MFESAKLDFTLKKKINCSHKTAGLNRMQLNCVRPRSVRKCLNGQVAQGRNL